MSYLASELVLDANGCVYHLGLKPENLAHNVILVGDQDRVALVSACFDELSFQSQHREFVCHTGTYQGKSISVLSTGIGTDNIDIVMNELDALVNIDLENRVNKTSHTALNIVRIGTCGILQREIPIHSYIVSTHAIGIDNVAHFYPIDFSPEEQALAKAFSEQAQLPSEIIPYCAASNEELTRSFKGDLVHRGITITSSGFYAPQGRSLRIGSKTSELNNNIEQFSYKDMQALNFEMESSALFALGKSMGHRCGTICLGIANRPAMQFSSGYQHEMKQLIQFVLDSL